jgi:hypothetical protein
MRAAFSLRGLSWWIVLTLVTVLTVVRFIGLEKSPPGFYNDEAYISTIATCINQTSHDADDVHMPLFSYSGGGGWTSPTHVYPVSIWISIFGHSISALRSYSALIMSLALIGLFFTGRLFMDNRGAFYVALAGCLSPWMFQFARMAVDDPETFLLGMIWGMYFFLRSSKIRDGILAALFFSIAVYAYGAGRVVLPFLFFLLLFVRMHNKGITAAYLLTFFVTGAVLCSPVIYKTFHGDIASRFGLVGLTSPFFKAQLDAEGRFGIIKAFFKNFFVHFSPNYLFLHGDSNLRHNSQFSGELSWLDDAALLAGVVLLTFSIRENKKISINRFVILALGGFAVGILPAAITWESLPHSLRMAGSWPFVSLLTGFVMWKSEQRWRLSSFVFASIATVFAILFLKNYFTVYPVAAEPWFDAQVKEAALASKNTGHWEIFRDVTKQYDEHAARYYRIQYGGDSCDSSVKFFREPTKALEQSPSSTTK